LEERAQCFCTFVDRKQLRGPLPARFAQRSPKSSIAKDLREGVGQSDRMMFRHKQTCEPVANHFRNATKCGRNDRQTRRHRFHHDGRKIIHPAPHLGNAGQNEERVARQPFDHLPLRQRTGQRDQCRQAGGCDLIAE